MNFAISPPGRHCCDSTVPLSPGALSSLQVHMPAPLVSPDCSGHDSSRACQLSGSGSASGAGAATMVTAAGTGATTMGAATGAASVSSMGTDAGPDRLEAKHGCAGRAAGAARRALPVNLPHSELISRCSWGMQRTYLVYGCPDYSVALAQARHGKSAMYCEPVRPYAAPTGTGAVTGAGRHTHSADASVHQAIYQAVHQTAHQTAHQTVHQTVHQTAHQTAHQTVHQTAHQTAHQTVQHARGSEPSQLENHLPGNDAQGLLHCAASEQAWSCTTAAATPDATATARAVGPVHAGCGTDSAHECSDTQWMIFFEQCWGKAASICSSLPDSRTHPGPVKPCHSPPPEGHTEAAPQSKARQVGAEGAEGAARSAMRQLCLFEDDFDEHIQTDTATPGTTVMGESRAGDQAPSLLPESHAAPGPVTPNSSPVSVCSKCDPRSSRNTQAMRHAGATSQVSNVSEAQGAGEAGKAGAAGLVREQGPVRQVREQGPVCQVREQGLVRQVREQGLVRQVLPGCAVSKFSYRYEDSELSPRPGPGSPGHEGSQIHKGGTALKAQESYTAVLSYTLSSCSAQSLNDDSELPRDTGSCKNTAGAADGSGRHQGTARKGGCGSRPGRDYRAQRGGPVTGEIGLGREAVFMRTALMPGYLVSSQNMPGRPGCFHGWSAMTARVPLDPERSVLGSDEESLMYAGSGFTVERNVISRHGLNLSASSFNDRSRLQRARIEIELPAFVVRG